MAAMNDYYWFISDPKSKHDKVANLIKFAKNSNLVKFCKKKKTLHSTDILKLLEKLYKYEMDPASIVEDAKRGWFHPQTNGRVKLVYPLSTLVKQSIIK